MNLQRKLAILADAAKYDASCASSGTESRTSRDGKGLGSTDPGMGICHSYAPDGRCISLLKILLTNACNFDCLYCINRASSNVQRARFTVEEAVNLTLDFYRRNYIEGLFLSSGIIRSPDYTMEQVVRVARSLREDHHFRGYIHLKTIPEADSALITEAGKYADRLSINIEVPTETSLANLAPEKDVAAIRRTMGRLRAKLDESLEDTKTRHGSPRRFAPAGQSTQMIVGVDASTDQTILQTSVNLYSSYRLKRIYYSAFSPIPDASRALPLRAPPLVREHRLYQADWLMRFYAFSLDDLTGSLDAGMLPLDIDPKLAWALRNRGRFPLDVNRASREELLRVPGFGTRTVTSILAARRTTRLRLADVLRLRVPRQKVLPFITCADHRPATGLIDGPRLTAMLRPPAVQLGFAFQEQA
jgi:putative DNA modification/repair radical SAM protein